MTYTLVLVFFINSKTPAVIDHVQMQSQESCQLAGEQILQKYTQKAANVDPWGGPTHSYYLCIEN